MKETFVPSKYNYEERRKQQVTDTLIFQQQIGTYSIVEKKRYGIQLMQPQIIINKKFTPISNKSDDNAMFDDNHW